MIIGDFNGESHESPMLFLGPKNCKEDVKQGL